MPDTVLTLCLTLSLTLCSEPDTEPDTVPDTEPDTESDTEPDSEPETAPLQDPVTGSAHTVLAPYWAAQLATQHMLARQVRLSQEGAKGGVGRWQVTASHSRCLQGVDNCTSASRAQGGLHSAALHFTALHCTTLGMVNMAKVVHHKGFDSGFVRRMFHFNYNSSLRQEHIHNLSCKAGKTLDQINYLKYISSYRKKKTKETRARNITSLLTILRKRENAQRTAPKMSHLYLIFFGALSYKWPH